MDWLNDSISLDELQLIDRLSNEFEERWEAGGRRPRIEEFWKRAPGVCQNLLLHELVMLEAQFRHQEAEMPQCVEYVERFAERRDVVERAFSDWQAQCLNAATHDLTSDTRSFAVTAQAQITPGTHPLPFRLGGYELLEVLGRGGMGVVYKARQSGTERTVALKLIRDDRFGQIPQAARQELLDRFRTEAQAAARLEHDHVVTIFDVGEIDGHLYYAMRLVDGVSLMEMLRAGPLAPGRAAHYVRQVADALHEAHSRSILHRDLKPHNVLVEAKSDRALLADFGLAKFLDRDQGLTESDAVLGSPCYMSPEMTFDATQATTASDIYGLGATLYHLLTGRPPFLAANPAATMLQVQRDEPVRPRDLNSSLPQDVETICLKCLEKSPTRRYATAAELRDELERFCRGDPVRARPVGAFERARRWSYRNPTRVLLLGVTAIAVLLAGGLLLLRQEAQRADAGRRHADAVAEVERRHAEKQKELADTQRYNALTIAAREEAARLEPGWTWRALEKLREAAGLDLSPVDPLQHRSLVAECRSQMDLRVSVAQLAKGFSAGSMAFSPDGQILAIGELKNHVAARVRLLNVPAGEEIATLTMPNVNILSNALKGFRSDGFRSLVFSSDGRLLAAGTRYGQVIVWNLAKPQEIAGRCQVFGEDEVFRLFFHSHDSAIVAHAHDGLVKTWDLQATEAVAVGTVEKVRSIAVDAQRNCVVAYADRQLRIVDLASGNDHSMTATVKDIRNMALSESGSVLAVTSGEGIDVYSRQGVLIRSLEDTQHPFDTLAGECLSFSADEAYLMETSQQTSQQAVTRVWEVASGKLVSRFAVPTSDRRVQAISPDMKFLVTAGPDFTHLHELRLPLQRFIAMQNAPIGDMTAQGGTLACVSEERAPFTPSNPTGHLLSISRFQAATQEHLGKTQLFFPFNLSPFREFLAVDAAGNLAASLPIPGALIWKRAAHHRLMVPRRLKSLGDPTPVRLDELLEESIECETIEDSLAPDGVAIRTTQTANAELRVSCDWLALPPGEWAVCVLLQVEGDCRQETSVEAGAFNDQGPTGEFQLLSRWTPRQGYHLYHLGWTDTERAPVRGFFARPSDPVNTRLRCCGAYVVRFPDLHAKEWKFREGTIAFDKNLSTIWGVTNNNTIVSWDLASGAASRRWLNRSTAGIDSIPVLVGGSEFVLAGCGDGSIHKQSLEGQSTRQQWGLGRVLALALHPEEKSFAAGLAGGHVVVGDAGTLEVLASPLRHAQAITAVHFAAKGVLVAGGQDGTLWLLELNKQTWRVILRMQFDGPIKRLASSGDSRLFILIEGETAVRTIDLQQLVEDPFELRPKGA